MEKSALRLKEILKTVNFEGRTIWIADAHRDGKLFVVCADGSEQSVKLAAQIEGNLFLVYVNAVLLP